MKGGRVAVIDGSYSLFSPREMQEKRGNGDGLGFRPIPGFRTIVEEAVADVHRSGRAGGRIVSVDVGVVCDTGAVQAVGRALHERVVKALQN
jgi:mediator of RNA polymerase II transcription subunit 14